LSSAEVRDRGVHRHFDHRPEPPPQASGATGRWLSGYFTLRDAFSHRAFSSVPETNYGYIPCRAGQFLVLMRNASIRYHGELVVECVPAGSEWLLRVSNAPVVWAPPPDWTRGVLWGDCPTFRHDVWRQASMGRRAPNQVKQSTLKQAPPLMIEAARDEVELEPVNAAGPGENPVRWRAVPSGPGAASSAN
jgi:hypothetical protein